MQRRKLMCDFSQVNAKNFLIETGDVEGINAKHFLIETKDNGELGNDFRILISKS